MNKKLFFTLALVGSFALSQPVYSATDAFTNAPGQAMYKDIIYGTITPGSDTCTVNVNSGAAGATVNWQNLNVPQNNALNFYFSDAGQYALNKVQSGISEIAGSIGYADGSQVGTVMISNPNGIICSGTSVINVGSLLLTTHDIINTDGKNFELGKKVGTDGDYHAISVLPNATMNLGGNLTIASLGIDMNGANITAKNSVLVTSDGLNYVIADKSNVAKNTVQNVETATVGPDNVCFDNHSDGYENYSTPIKVANTAFKTADGKIVITSTKAGEKISINSSKFASDVDINSAGGVDVVSSSKLAGTALADDTKGSFLGNVNITAKGNVNLTSKDANSVVPFSKNLTITTDGNIDMKNVRIMEDYSQKATLSGQNITIRNYALDTFDWSNNILGDVDITATGSIKTNQVQIAGNSVMNAGNLIELSGTLLGQDSSCTADLTGKNIIIKNSRINDPDTQGYYAQVLANLNAKASKSISLINNGVIPTLAHNAVLEAPTVNIEDYAFKSLTVNNFDTLNANNVAVASDLSLTGKQNSLGENVTNVKLNKLKVNGNLTTNEINDLSLTNAQVKGKYNANNVNKIAIDSSKFGDDVNITDAGTVDIVSSSKLAGTALADDTKGAFLGNVNIEAKGDVNISSKDANSVVPFSKDLTIKTDGNIDLKNVRIMEDYSQKATLSGENVNIQNYELNTFDWSNNILGDVNINAKDSITTNQVQIAGNSVMNAGNLIKLEGTLLGQSSDYTADLTGKNIVIKNSPINPPDTQGYYAQVLATLNAKADESISFINNGLIPALAHDAIVEAPKVTIEDYAFRSLTVKNFENLNTNNASVDSDLTLTGKQNAEGENISNANLDKLTVNGTLTTNDMNDVDLTNSHIKGDYIADNVNDLYMFNDIIDGNIIITNVNKLVQDTVTGNDTMTLDNINDWTMENTHIKNGIFATNIGSYTSETGNNTANGLPYTYVQPSSEFDVDSTLRAYVDTLDPGTATEANAGAGQFVARAFAAAEEDDEDYKEEFLTRYVKEDKDGNFYTTNTFKAE